MYPREQCSVVTIYNLATILCFTGKGISFLLYFIFLDLIFLLSFYIFAYLSLESIFRDEGVACFKPDQFP